MSAKCAKCTKTVYKAEEFRCLDQIWHKACFKCKECGMTLTMKNYKGFEKQPYCGAHYPQLKATSVVQTPESQRLAKISEMNSGKLYRKDFEESIHNPTAVADDPETARVRNQGKIIGVNYAAGGQPRQASVEQQHYDEEPHAPAPPAAMPPGPPQAPPGRRSDGARYQALYDYEAADPDEVSFAEGDYLTQCEVIDEGWVMGTVENTGQRGMIPSNYIQEV